MKPAARSPLARRRPRFAPRLREYDGPLTEELVLAPWAFGLGHVPRRLAPDATAKLVCGFCSTGCSLDVHLRDGAAINLTPTPAYPVNLGMACPKGWEALTPLSAHDRATVPLWRGRDGKLRPIDWDTALRRFCERFKAIQASSGPGAVAFLSSGQIVTEEMALLGALTKFGMGFVHGDSNTRQCMATSVAAYKQSFGFDAPPYTYRDFEESDVLVLIGSNLCIAHPILWQRILRNRRRPEIIVIDPRRTETAIAATQHYGLRPKSDLVLLYGIAHLLLERGWIDAGYIAQHTRGFEDFAAHVKAFTPERVSAATGLTAEQIDRLCTTIHRGRRVSFWWTMGVNQGHEATRTAQAIINLALMTGNLGRPGTGANSVTGQCNAMGSRLFSNTSSLFGGRQFEDPAHRRQVARVLGIDPGLIPEHGGLAYDEIVQGIAEGRIKGLWIVGTNSSHSWINQTAFNELVRRLEFLVVQEMYHTTETAERAHLVLPAAGWGEKDGTFINSERRIGVVKKVARAPGTALADFSIFRAIAGYWGCGDLFHNWRSPAAVFQIMKELSRGQPCDFTGVRDYSALEEAGGVQWPFPEGVALAAPERRLFEDGAFFHSDGRARFIYEEPRVLPEPPDDEYPLLLLTGRGSASQWHTETRTAKSAVLRRLSPAESYVEIHPDDARRLAIAPHERVTVASRRGHLEAAAFITPTVGPGQVFVPMHYAATNRLTHPTFDPYSRQPSYKACAVKVIKRE